MTLFRHFAPALIALFLPVSAIAQGTLTVHDEAEGKDEVFSLPEGMELSEDALLKEWHGRQYLFADSACQNPDYNPEFTDEQYRERLERIPAIMELPYNPVVRKFIDQYSNRLRRSVSIMLGTGNFYIPIFEEALEAYGLPLELKYLPVIESSLEPRATSRAGAAGLWQFMVATARRYDLKINSLVDERRDPVKSTWAAARYLRDLYNIYSDWSLALAAYNAGPQNVNKAIHRAGGERDYWKIYRYLPTETRGYVPAFIAANYIMTYYCEHNICPMKTKYPIQTDTVMVSRNLHLQQIAELCGTDVDAVRALNPQYRADVVPGLSEPCAVRLPQETLNRFLDLGDTVYVHRAAELLGRRSLVEVDESAVPAGRQQGRSGRNARGSKRSRGAATATVRKGDTLDAIARRNHTTVDALRRRNNIKGSTIRPGQKLRLK